MLDDLRKEPSGKFENFCRMSATDFEYLLSKIGPFIAKRDTNMRESIPIQERLAVTLRFFASGDSYISLSYLFNTIYNERNTQVHNLRTKARQAVGTGIRAR